MVTYADVGLYPDPSGEGFRTKPQDPNRPGTEGSYVPPSVARKKVREAVATKEELEKLKSPIKRVRKEAKKAIQAREPKAFKPQTGAEKAEERKFRAEGKKAKLIKEGFVLKSGTQSIYAGQSPAISEKKVDIKLETRRDGLTLQQRAEKEAQRGLEGIFAFRERVEERKQEKIKAEKAKALTPSFIPQKEIVPQSILEKIEKRKEKKGVPLVDFGKFEERFPKTARFTQAAVIGGVTIALTKQLPPTITQGVIFRTAEEAVGASFVGSKVKEVVELQRPKKEIAIETALDVGGFIVGGKATGLKNIKVEKIELPIKEKVPTIRSFEEVKVTVKGKSTEVTGGKLLFQEPTPIKTEFKTTGLGLEVGTRSIVLGAKTPEGIKIGRPKLERPVALESLTKDIPAPETATGGKLFRDIFELTPAEQTRIKSGITASRILGKDPGVKVKEVLFELEFFKEPKKATKLIETTVAKEKGVFFGSVISKRLPKEFQTFTKKSDIDIVFPSRTVEQLTPKVSSLAKELSLLGEKVRVSKKNPLIIEKIPKGKGLGEKILEFKSGLNQETLGEELAPAGFFGFRFPDIKGGQSLTTTRFGKGAGILKRGKGIKAGEQFLRKGAGSFFFRPESKIPELPKSFQVAGVLPKAKRGIKDISGFIATGKGLVSLRESSLLRRRLGTKKAGKALDEFLGSFTVQQRKDIAKDLLTRTEGGFKVELSPSTAPSKITPAIEVRPFKLKPSKESRRFESPRITSPSISRFEISPSPAISLISKSPAKSIISKSPRPSPSPKPSKSPSPSPSSIFKSPPPSKSPLPSISSFTSPSPSPKPSPSPSPIPSPSPSPVPSPSPSLITTRFRIPKTPPPSIRFPKINFGISEKKARKPLAIKRITRFTPTVVGIELGLKGKKKKLEEETFTGLEVRPIPV